MTFVYVVVAVVVYGVIAYVSSAAERTRSTGAQGEVVFPVLMGAKVLSFIGGMFCVGFGAYGLITHMGLIFSVSFLLIGLLTLLFPFHPIILSPSGVETRGALWWRKLTFRWNEIERVEVRKAGRMVSLVHGKSSITHSRYHVDQQEFIRQVQLHVSRNKWVEKGLR